MFKKYSFLSKNTKQTIKHILIDKNWGIIKKHYIVKYWIEGRVIEWINKLAAFSRNVNEQG